MRVLLIEDDAKAARLVAKGLREDGFVVDVASSGEEGDEMASVSAYDVIVLDWLLPGRDGLAICRQLRGRGLQTPILMLTARDGVTDRVAGLDTGADDYLTKPFAFAELLARIRALLRRSELTRLPVLRVDTLTLDPVSRRVARGSVPIDLTATEYAILETLMRQAGRIVTRTRLAESVWERDADGLANVIDVHVSHLRRKIDIGDAPPILHTERGAGFRLGSLEP